jgi:hypothetical protein
VSAFVLPRDRISLLDQDGVSRYVRGVAVDIGDLSEPVQAEVEQLVRAMSFRPLV